MILKMKKNNCAQLNCKSLNKDRRQIKRPVKKTTKLAPRKYRPHWRQVRIAPLNRQRRPCPLSVPEMTNKPLEGAMTIYFKLKVFDLQAKRTNL